jgi:hypothetical protein
MRFSIAVMPVLAAIAMAAAPTEHTYDKRDLNGVLSHITLALIDIGSLNITVCLL